MPLEEQGKGRVPQLSEGGVQGSSRLTNMLHNMLRCCYTTCFAVTQHVTLLQLPFASIIETASFVNYIIDPNGAISICHPVPRRRYPMRILKNDRLGIS